MLKEALFEGSYILQNQKTLPSQVLAMGFQVYPSQQLFKFLIIKENIYYNEMCIKNKINEKWSISLFKILE